jgi:cyclic pyranopterin phosphate synthase
MADKNKISSSLTHLDDKGQARMVDIQEKGETKRKAVASGLVIMDETTLALILDGAMAKGDVLATARIAGIMAAKKTSELIPMCHPLALSSVVVDIAAMDNTTLKITATAKLTGKTGVEMEALAAVSVAALTIYDMCKAVDRSMVISEVQLDHKSGGKSGTYDR